MVFIACAVGAVVAALLVALLAGFGVFVASLARESGPLPPPADGIVVLTGGADRITDATILLTEQRSRRLLITGVHRDTTLAEISRTVPATEKALSCCTELGRFALNTRGNAIEAAVWARANGFHSLIVVTSAWHMPRALVELRRAMPEIALVPYPVIARSQREPNWQSRLATGRLLFAEYVKFLAAYVGIGPWPALASETELLRRSGAS
ncbi:uncharacterized SAM-binding protein YcdF (DUF218 family) [Angulomicrobium tetraedrale]|uniref:Uncharacterized SAM-binding protein YcdF (DUF218 family) n=1 Tax=Ancylobacter tetraedralis TaxID=217068 RepID=A0A839Z8V1_9HYPH|nr:uncharacterized SAM-binding protein YcdF (DUF218 family) [Ancylobacter tetraedralis]